MPVPAQLTVLNGSGSPVAVNAPLNPGRAIAAESRPVALSSEDFAAIDGLEAKLDAVVSALGTLGGYVDGLETLQTATNNKLDAVVTALAAANASLDDIEAQAESATDSGVEPHQPCDVIAVTPTMDTAAYASGDVFFNPTAIAGACRVADLHATLASIAVIDKDDQKPAMRLIFMKANNSLGTINSAPSISDANAADILGTVDIAAADYVDLGGVSFACASPSIGSAWKVGLLEAASGTSTVYVAAMLTAGTPTMTASGLVLNIGVIQQ